jgi:hypothetical protein
MLEYRDQERVFDSDADRTLRGYGALAGGAALVVVAIAGFFIGLRTNPGMFAFQAMTTVPMLFAVGLFATAFATLRSPTRVIVGPEGLTVLRGATLFGRWRWDEIALAPAGKVAISDKRTLRLYGSTGKVLVTLTDDLRDFDVMSVEIAQRMARNPAPQRDTVARGKHRRTGAFLMVGGVAFFALAGANAWIALHELRSKELLRTQGQPAAAVVVRKFTAPDGRTRRIEYKVDAPGAPTENVEVTEIVWQVAEPTQHIPVIAVPGHPDVSHLVTGQVDESMTTDPKTMLALSAAMAVMSIVFFVVGVLNRRGLQVKWDAVRKRPRLAPIDEG